MTNDFILAIFDSPYKLKCDQNSLCTFAFDIVGHKAKVYSILLFLFFVFELSQNN